MRFYPLLFALALVACDSTAPADVAPPAGFEAEVSGALSASLAGSTSVGADLEGVGLTREIGDDAVLTAFQLDDAATDGSIVLVGVTEGALVEGEYSVSDIAGGGGTGAGFIGAFLPGTDGDPPALGRTGDVTITAVDAESVSGSFDFEAVVVSFEDGVPAEDVVRVEGSFTVDLEDDPS